MKKYKTEVYLNGKKISIKNCKKIKGFTSIHKFLKELAAFPGCTVTKNILIYEEELTIKVYNLSKNKLFE